jgi:hypothetical protein
MIGQSFGYRFDGKFSKPIEVTPGPGSYKIMEKVKSVILKKKKKQKAKKQNFFGGAPRFTMSHREKVTPAPKYFPKPKRFKGAARIVKGKNKSKIQYEQPSPGPFEYETSTKINKHFGRFSKDNKVKSSRKHGPGPGKYDLSYYGRNELGPKLMIPLTNKEPFLNGIPGPAKYHRSKSSFIRGGGMTKSKRCAF